MRFATETSYGWLIRDAAEEDADGAGQSFISSEAVREPPTPPQLVLRFEDTGDAAILLTAGSNRNRIANNTTMRTSDTAIALDDSDENEVINNVLHHSGGAGIGLGSANDSLIRGNDVRFNPGGIELAGSSNNCIEDNDASYTGASGITVEGGTDNEIVNNAANDTGASGISVEAETLDPNGNPIDGFLIEGNEANGNLSSGITVGGSGHTIADNDAYNNLAFGIFAADGNSDGQRLCLHRQRVDQQHCASLRRRWH